MAAAIWVGTNIAQMILYKPNINSIRPTKIKNEFQQLGKIFKPVVDICIIILIATGAIIVFNRLTSNDITVAYVVTLGIKVALTAWMLILLHSERRHIAAISDLDQNSTESGWINDGRDVRNINVNVSMGMKKLLIQSPSQSSISGN